MITENNFIDIFFSFKLFIRRKEKAKHLCSIYKDKDRNEMQVYNRNGSE